QISGAVRHFDAHDLFHCFAVTQSVAAAADAADTLRDIDILFKISFFNQFLKSSMDKSNTRDSPNYRLILKYQIQMDRFRKHRMLRTEWYDTSLCHDSTPSS